MDSKFGTTLKTLLRQRGITARKLALDLNKPLKSVQEWIGPNGRTPRDTQAIKALAAYFDCSIHFLLFGEEEPRAIPYKSLERFEFKDGVYEVTIKKLKD